MCKGRRPQSAASLQVRAVCARSPKDAKRAELTALLINLLKFTETLLGISVPVGNPIRGVRVRRPQSGIIHHSRRMIAKAASDRRRIVIANIGSTCRTQRQSSDDFSRLTLSPAKGCLFNFPGRSLAPAKKIFGTRKRNDSVLAQLTVMNVRYASTQRISPKAGHVKTGLQAGCSTSCDNSVPHFDKKTSQMLARKARRMR